VADVGPLHRNRVRAGSFGIDARQYDCARPTYPSELVDLLVSDGPQSVLDVGCGTGIAARLFSDRGCEVVGLEPDPRMAAVARRRGTYVEDGTLEEWSAGERRFDLLIAAQSWHWVEPNAGAARAAEVVRPGGRIGLFWNQSFPLPPAQDALKEAYEQHAPELGDRSVLLGLRDDRLYQGIADVFESNSRYTEVAMLNFGHDAVYSTDSWLALTSTHSDHRTLPSPGLDRLLDAVRVRIDETGGRVAVHYETTLVTARTTPG
jgi:SAM-dependent methyltransferase